MANMGLQTAVNSSIDARAAIALAQDPNTAKPDEKTAVELFNIPDSDKMNGITMLPGKTFAQRKLPVSIEDQKYIRKCLAKHGDDYHSMMRDIKTNDMQYTEYKLKKMAARFFLLTDGQVKVEIPEKVRHLMTCCIDEKKENE
jgi:nucleolar protein 16